jgi:hypothetical protein
MKADIRWLVFLLVLVALSLPAPASADASHARIVRLSLVQGDVRFAREFHDDPMSDAKAVWEVAPLNLPIRQGYALATENGRAEVEFENGAMAFIGANTVVEFYELSLADGAHVTRLVLRQGTGFFYVHPANGDYFSVTGGDFTVQANGRTRFRLDNYDDGSTVNVEQGNVEVVHKKETKSLEKGQSLSVRVTDPDNFVVGRTADSDDFDKWVSGRIDSVSTATTYSNQYVSTSNYASGFADLYTYGSWFSMGGYYGWRPFGAGLGWCPFDAGNWYMDPSIGWSFLSPAPWGWLPYHYGGWIFSPIYGWAWVPSGFGGGPIYYRPVTAVWVHSGPTLGIVPLHPADKNGKLPQNLSQGVFAVSGQTLAKTAIAAGNEKWSVVRNAPQGTLGSSALAASTAPARVSRTILSGNAGSRSITVSRESSIAYDPGEHRFVNSNRSAVAARENTRTQPNTSVVGKVPPPAGAPAAPIARTGQPPATRVSTPSRAAFATPAPARGSGPSGGSAVWSGSHGSGGSTGSVRGSSASSGSSHASSSASHH